MTHYMTEGEPLPHYLEPDPHEQAFIDWVDGGYQSTGIDASGNEVSADEILWAAGSASQMPNSLCDKLGLARGNVYRAGVREIQKRTGRRVLPL